MPLKINTLPNKSIHPGSTGSAGSRAVLAGAGGGVSMVPGTVRDGVGEGVHHSIPSCGEKWAQNTSLLSLSAPDGGRGWSRSFAGWLWSGEDGRSPATLLHPSGKSEESRSPKVSSASFCAGSGRGGPERCTGPVLEHPQGPGHGQGYRVTWALRQTPLSRWQPLPGLQFLPGEVVVGVTRFHA